MEQEDGNKTKEIPVDFSSIKCETCKKPINPDNHYRIGSFYFCAHNQKCSSVWWGD